MSADLAHVAPGEPLIQLEAVTKTYRSGTLDVEVLHGVSLTIRRGEFVAIMGASGSGKTTLMNLIGCLDRPTSGRYLFAGHDVSGLDRDQLALLRRDAFGFVFQQYNLLANANAVENVEVPAIYAGMPKAARDERAARLLTALGLGERLDHRPNQLSGGQQQRVSIARALMNGGAVILADEPTGALDSKSGREVMALLHQLNADGHTIVLITHDAQVAAQAHRVVSIADGVIVGDAQGGTAPAPAAPGMPLERDDDRLARPRADLLPESPSTVLIKDGFSLPVGSQGDSTGKHPALAPPPARDTSGMTDVSEAVKMALRSLRANLFRTVLTLLGIVIGVGSVVAMLALGDGAKQDVLSRIQAMGTNLLLVRPGAPNMRGPEAGTIATLNAEDAEEIARLPNVNVAVPEMGGTVTIRYGNADYQTSVTATSGDYPVARDWVVKSGVFFGPEEVKSYVPVVVLGQTVVDNLFRSGEDPIGRYVLIKNVPFQVIGILARKGASPFGSDLDDAAFVPLSTGSLRLFGQRYLRAITVQVEDLAGIDGTQQQITELLVGRHRTNDVQIRNTASIMEMATATQDTMTVLLGSIAAISLLVGGIGVMNIMLVSVTERTREIGIRMATGARTANILLQFITEAVVVCAIGGGLGVAGGLATAFAARAFGSAVVFSTPPVVLAFGCAFITGLVFGYMPARKAANLDPVTALSAE